MSDTPLPIPANDETSTASAATSFFAVPLAEITDVGLARIMCTLQGEMERRALALRPRGNVIPIAAILEQEDEERRLERLGASELGEIASKLNVSIQRGGIA